MEKTLVTYVQSKHHDLRIQTMYSGKRKSLAITPSDVDIFSQTSETLNGTASKNIISCAKAAHDRHSPFAECINAFFSLALIISYSLNHLRSCNDIHALTLCRHRIMGKCVIRCHKLHACLQKQLFHLL